MNEKKAKQLRREAKATYGVSELVSKYVADQRTLRQRPGGLTGTLHLTGAKAIYKKAKRNAEEA